MYTIPTHSHVDSLLEKAEHALDLHRPDLAIQLANEALKIDPESSQAFFLLARAYEMKKNTAVAAQAIQEALRINPDDAYAHCYFAHLLLKLKNLPAAEQEFSVALTLAPDSGYVHFRYAYFQLRYKENVERAYFHARRALEINPDEASCHILLGEVLEEMKQYGAAEQAYREALRLEPESYLPHYAYGVYLLVTRNRPQEAFSYLREAVRMNPEDEDVREHFLTALKAKNKFYALFWSGTLWFNRNEFLRSALFFGLIVFFIVVGMIFEDTNQTVGLLLTLPFLILYCLFCLVAWFTDPIFNYFVRKGWIK